MVTYFTLLHITEHYGNNPLQLEIKQNRNQWDIESNVVYQFQDNMYVLCLFSVSSVKD